MHSIAKPARKYVKNVTVNNQNLVALIDTGSDLSLIREDQYERVGSPNLIQREIVFRGIGTQDFKTKGQFDIEIEIDNECFLTNLSVVPNELLKYDLLIGTDLLDRTNLYVEEEKSLYGNRARRYEKRIIYPRYLKSNYKMNLAMSI